MMMKKFLILLVCVLTGIVGMAAGVVDDGQDSRNMRKYRALYLEALNQREAGNPVACYRMLQRAIELNPNGAEAYFELGMLANDSSYALPSFEYLEKAYSLAPDNMEYKFMMGVGCIYRSDPRGEEILKACAQDKDYRDRALEVLCRYYVMSDRYDDMCAVLDRWRVLSGDDEEFLMRKIEFSMNMGHYGEISAIADTLMRVSPGLTSAALRYKAAAYVALNDYDKAYDVAKQMAALPDADGYEHTIFYQYAVNAKDTALINSSRVSMLLSPAVSPSIRLESYRTLLKDCPQSEREELEKSLVGRMMNLHETGPDLYAAMLSLRLREKKNENLLAADKDLYDSISVLLLRKVVEINPSAEDARLSLLVYGNTYLSEDEYKRICIDGVKQNADHPLIFLLAGNCYMSDGDEDTAFGIYERGLKKVNDTTEPTLVSMIYSACGDILYKKGRTDESFGYYDKALAYDSLNVTCLNNYAYHFSLSGRNLDRALKMIVKAIDQSPDEPTYLDTYAWVLFVRGDYAKAKEVVDKILALVNTDKENISAVYYDHAGDIYYHLGKVKQAVGFWKQAAAMEDATPLMKQKAQRQRYIKE